MIDEEDIAMGTFIETEATVPNAVIAWAAEAAGDTGEEGEWNVFFPDGQAEHSAQVWPERECEPDVALVGFWIIDHGDQCRAELKPDEARQLAASLLCAAAAAEDRVAMWREDPDAEDKVTDLMAALEQPVKQAKEVRDQHRSTVEMTCRFCKTLKGIELSEGCVANDIGGGKIGPHDWQPT